jgi:hypothetical protein
VDVPNRTAEFLIRSGKATLWIVPVLGYLQFYDYKVSSTARNTLELPPHHSGGGETAQCLHMTTACLLEARLDCSWVVEV